MKTQAAHCRLLTAWRAGCKLGEAHLLAGGDLIAPKHRTKHQIRCVPANSTRFDVLGFFIWMIKMLMTVDRVDGIVPHCETTWLNSHCPYIALGCKGCESAVLCNLAQPTAELRRLGIANQKRRTQLEVVKFLRHMNTGEKQDFVRTIERMKAAAITVPAFLDFAAAAARDFAAAASGGRFVFSENRSSKRKKAVGGKRWRR